MLLCMYHSYWYPSSCFGLIEIPSFKPLPLERFCCLVEGHEKTQVMSTKGGKCNSVVGVVNFHWSSFFI